MTEFLQRILFLLFPITILFAMLFLFGFVLLEKITIALRLRRKERRKEIIKRWKEQRKHRKAVYKRMKKQLGGDR